MSNGRNGDGPIPEGWRKLSWITWEEWEIGEALGGADWPVIPTKEQASPSYWEDLDAFASLGS